jgi:hydrogen peroxide-dependent heme synthase
MADAPPVPLTIEGSAVLHQMFRFNWREWRSLPEWHKQRIADEALQFLSDLEKGSTTGHPNQSRLYSQLGHKGDLMLIHFRDSLEDLNRTELALAHLELFDYFHQTHSYVSVVELGLYESTIKTFNALVERGVAPHSEEWNKETKEVSNRQSAAMASRLYPPIPQSLYLCFYPMDRKRGDKHNWYTAPMPERQRMMQDHGAIGRRYAGEVRQIITGSIGFDDWEWGVDLFADDPLVFKRLIYEMRFDEASALYAAFGPFYIGVLLPAEKLHNWLGSGVDWAGGSTA